MLIIVVVMIILWWFCGVGIFDLMVGWYLWRLRLVLLMLCVKLVLMFRRVLRLLSSNLGRVWFS